MNGKCSIVCFPLQHAVTHCDTRMMLLVSCQETACCWACPRLSFLRSRITPKQEMSFGSDNWSSRI
jgi:hypothetical protein